MSDSAKTKNEPGEKDKTKNETKADATSEQTEPKVVTPFNYKHQPDEDMGYYFFSRRGPEEIRYKEGMTELVKRRFRHPFSGMDKISCIRNARTCANSCKM